MTCGRVAGLGKAFELAYTAEPVDAAMDLLGQLAELATEPLSSLGSARPEGVS